MSTSELPKKQLSNHEVTYAWQFQTHTNKGQPDFVTVQQAMGGPRAIARPPATEKHPHPIPLYMHAMDWLVCLEGGIYICLNDMAAHYLLVDEEDDDDKTL